jgi:glyoxylase-like metal-dependent hydrolase (beta-lactamase superfamily II)
MLLIDTGWDVLCGHAYIDEAVRRFGIPWENVTIFLTHFHHDHYGNVGYCLERGAQRVLHGPESTIDLAQLQAFYVLSGSAARGFRKATERDHDAIDTHRELPPLPAGGLISESAVIDFAGYRFRPLLTPGHTTGHLCLAEPDQHFVFGGDHFVLGNPLLRQFLPDEHVIRTYLETIPRLRGMRFEEIYMSHHEKLAGDEVPEILLSMESYFVRPLSKDLKLVDQRPTTVFDLTDSYYAYRGERLADLDAFARLRRLATKFGELEYLHDIGEIKRGQDDEDSLVYYV